MVISLYQFNTDHIVIIQFGRFFFLIFIFRSLWFYHNYPLKTSSSSLNLLITLEKPDLIHDWRS